ncbi:MAG: AAA family ATPase [Acidimicrobiales bacterium]
MAVLCPVLIGRDDETRVLESALDALLAGRGRAVAITGEPGIGKSRLAREIGARASAGGCLVAVGRAVESGAATPYRPITEAMHALLRDRSLPDDSELSPWLSALGSIAPSLADGTQSGAPAAYRAEAIIQVLRRIEAPGIVVILEDLHWADPDSVSVVEYLADNLAAEHVLLVVTSRREPRNPACELLQRLADCRSIEALSLSRLSGECVVAMVQACVPDADDSLLERIGEVSDGVPFLVEETLASPGIPVSFAETVAARLQGLGDDERAVLSLAAVIGRFFDWRLVVDASGQGEDAVVRALEAGIDRQLLLADGDSFSFRHALTREAILERLLPPRTQALAASALRSLDERTGRAESTGAADLAASLALQAGQLERGADLLVESGLAAMGRGALDTAADTLARAAGLGDPRAAASLVEALALAGRADEANAAFAAVDTTFMAAGIRVAMLLHLAQAAVSACRWDEAALRLGQVDDVLAAQPDESLVARAAVLRAELALAADDLEGASALAGSALDNPAAAPEVRCQAFDLRGRCCRLANPVEAKFEFEQALRVAEAHELPLSRVQALHELGTIDMFDHAGSERLLTARQAAGDLGALATAASLDLQLSAVGHSRFDLDMSIRHARSALALAGPLHLQQVRAKSLAILAENSSWRNDFGGMERYIALSIEAAPSDRFLVALGWGSRGMRELLHGDRSAAVPLLAKAAAIFAGLPQAEPACLRAVWPVLLASVHDRRAGDAIREARSSGVNALNLNRGLLAVGEAILAGSSASSRDARRLVEASAGCFTNCETWLDIGRWLAAEAALTEGWDDPQWWLAGVPDRLAVAGLGHLAQRCRSMQAGSQRWTSLGITAREAEVLDLIVDGLANKEIAVRLRLSSRTVEKHVEALLRKLEMRSRTQLVSVALRSDR